MDMLISPLELPTNCTHHIQRNRRFVMKKWGPTLLLAGVVAACVTSARADDAKSADSKKAPAALDFKVKSIAGKEVDLSEYKGKVIVVVNVASECGLTPQYEGLEALYE